jgi:DNA-binding NarL/FixJ family response regulator
MPATALIAEDHDVTRRGLRQVLRDRLDIEVLDATGDGLEVVPLVEAHDPDLLILDLALPGLNGLDILHRLKEHDAEVRVVVLSMRSEDAYVAEALQTGACAYVLKGEPLAEIERAVQVALDGGRYTSEAVAGAVGAADEDRRAGRYGTLTDREQEVLHLIAEGHDRHRIADRLSIAATAVDEHREAVKDKLGLETVAQMMSYVMEHNPIPGGEAGRGRP